MTTSEYNLYLLTGIPGTGKTTFGNALANEFGFHHCDLEDTATRNLLDKSPIEFVRKLARQKRHTVVTWGFAPDDEPSVQSVLYFKVNGFKLMWFDGNRPAALRMFLKRGDVPELCFYKQMCKIEQSQIIDRIKPTVIDPFDEHEQFKPPAEFLQEIKLK